MITAVILNWNTTDIAEESARRLRFEVDKVILVDNGSETPPSNIQRVKHINNDKNLGNSIARNQGIRLSKGDVLLLDGDILYVPGSVKFLKQVLDKHPEAGCVGYDGLLCSINNRGEETKEAEEITEPEIDKKICSIPENQPIAWTQYGLFREEVFKKCRFDESDLYGIPGYGFEDNDLYEQMKRFKWHSYSVSGIKYFHDQSSSKRFLAKYNQPTCFYARYEQFRKKWGK